MPTTLARQPTKSDSRPVMKSQKNLKLPLDPVLTASIYPL